MQLRKNPGNFVFSDNKMTRITECALNKATYKQDVCTGVHSAYRRQENGHNLDIWVLWLRQRQMQIFLGLKVGEGLDFRICMGFKSST